MTRWAPPWRRKPRLLCSGTGGPPAAGQILGCPICGRIWDTEGSAVPRHHIGGQHRKRAQAG